MKKNIINLILIILSSSFSFAQSFSETYKFSKDIEAEIEKDTVAWKYQTAAVNYSFIGDYKNTLMMWDKGASPRVYIPRNIDSLTLSRSKIHDAKDYIINRSEKEQIIIINEAHHNPNHRIFTRSLLQGLYKNGYRYLGLEALFDTSVNERNYAITESGFYTVEPQFGNLIYEARRIGFIIFGYEASPGKNGKEREIEQAKNIHKFMGSNTSGKYIIHCGFDHVYEKEVQVWEKAMAGRLKEYTGIDPFTIDQVKFSERSKPEFGHYFSYATEERKPFILVEQNNQVFNGSKEPKQTDLVIIHPVTQYENERPIWVSWNRYEYWIPRSKQKKYKYPVQILAYRINEYNGIPSDIIEIKNEHDRKPLYLEKGKYKIVIRNSLYKSFDEFNVDIDK